MRGIPRKECPDAGIAPCGHELEFVLVVVGVELGIGVYLGQHTVDGPAHGGVGRERIDVEHIQLTIDVGKDLKVARDVKTGLLAGLLSGHGGKEHEK